MKLNKVENWEIKLQQFKLKLKLKPKWASLRLQWSQAP